MNVRSSTAIVLFINFHCNIFQFSLHESLHVVCGVDELLSKIFITLAEDILKPTDLEETNQIIGYLCGGILINPQYYKTTQIPSGSHSKFIPNFNYHNISDVIYNNKKTLNSRINK